MIPRSTIEQILQLTKIEDVVSDYVTLHRRGVNMIGLCPFHDEKTPSFTVSPTKGLFKCFGCGKGGNATKFLMEIDQISYSDAIRKLAERYHIPIKEREETEEEKQQRTERDALFAVNDWANRWFQKVLWKTEEGKTIGLRYFIERGLNEKTIKDFALGYSPQKNQLSKDAIKEQFSEEVLLKTGLSGKSQQEGGGLYDRFRDRVIFPTFSVSGKIVGFVGRILKKKENTGKYVNSPESIIYSKQNELYGLFQAKNEIAKQGFCYLVEGQMDVLSMVQSGLRNVVSSGGTSLTQNQIRLLHRFTENITILYDGDAAGIHAALRGIDMILEEGINVRVVLLPDGEDPDSMAQKNDASILTQYLKENTQDFLRFKAKLLMGQDEGDPIKRTQTIRSVLQSIAVIPDRLTRDTYIKEAATWFNHDEKNLLQDVINIRKQNRENEQKQQETAQRLQDNRLSTEQQNTQTENTVNQEQKPPAEIKLTEDTTLDKIYATNCANLLRALMWYGKREISTTDGELVCVADYIISDLQNDGITMQPEQYQAFLEEYKENLQASDFEPKEYFLNHPNPEMATVAYTLNERPYELSKIYQKQAISENIQAEVTAEMDEVELTNHIGHLLNELKLTIMKIKERDLLLKINLTKENNDLQYKLLVEYSQIKNIIQLLNNALGRQ